MIPDLTNFGFARIARALEAHCREAGIQLLIACSEDDPALEQRVVDNLISRQVDGLIVASSGHSDDIYARIHDRLPVVQLDRHIGESRLPMVISDACKATAELVRDMTSECGEEIYYFGGLLDLSPAVTGWRAMSWGSIVPVLKPMPPECAIATISRAPVIS